MATSKLHWRLALLLPLLLLLLLLLPAQAEGSAGVVTSFKVASRIEHRYAITRVVSTMANPNPIHADVRFKMALPKAAFISAFTIEVGGVNYTSAVGDQLPPFTGRHTERRERSAWLVRQARDSLQLLEVSAGVKGYGKVTFHLTYEELLRKVDGRYNYEVQVRPGQVVREVEVLVHVLDREAITDYRIHQLPGQHLNTPRPGASVSEKMRRPGEVQVRYLYTSKDLPSPDVPSQPGEPSADGTFALSYMLRTRRDGGEIQRENHHFVHTFCPEGLARMSTHTVLVLDVSLSMKGDQFNHMKDAVHAMLEELQPLDTFEVLVFSTDVKSLGVFNGTRNHRRKVRRMLKRLRPLGNSNLSPAYHTALRRAVHHLEKNVARKVVMVSDGHGTKGQTDPAAIRASLAAANTRRIPIFGVVLQPDADVRLIEQVSEDSRGKTLKVYPHDGDLKGQVREFFRQVSSPLLTEVKMEYPRGQVMEDLLVRDHNSDYFYSGREMVTAGVLTPDTTTFHPAVTARGRNGLLRLHVDRVDSRYMTGPGVKGETGVVTRIWAYLMVQDLLARMAASDDPQVIVRLHYTLQDLATRHRFVTEFTALLVVLPNHGYELVYPQQERPRYKKDFHPGHGPANQSFVVGDPHFVVHTPGVHLPFCFSYHGHHGAFLSLIQDPVTGIMVNGQVTSASHDPSQTFFSRLFFALGHINVTVTQDHIHIDCLDKNRTPLVSHVERSLYPFYDKRGRPYRKKNRRRENETVVKKGARGLRRKGNNLSRQCNQRTAWQKGMARMYGSAMILQKQGTSQLDVILGDGEAHFGVTRTSGGDGQRYLGFYVEGQNMLSPHAHGIIGQFNNKTVELLPSEARRCGDTDTSTLLRVQRRGPQGLVETSQLCGQRGLHQSSMSDTQVDCIDVGDEGLGLLDRTNYDLPCLACAAAAS